MEYQNLKILKLNNGTQQVKSNW